MFGIFSKSRLSFYEYLIVVSFIEEDKSELEVKFKRIKEEKDVIEKELRMTQKKLDEAVQVASQAREKVKDALAMAQDALINEANLMGNVRIFM